MIWFCFPLVRSTTALNLAMNLNPEPTVMRKFQAKTSISPTVQLPVQTLVFGVDAKDAESYLASLPGT